MVLDRSQSSDSSASGNRHMRDSSLMACTELLLGAAEPVTVSAAASSAAVAAALTVDLAAAVAGSVSSAVPTGNQQLEAAVLELSQSGDSGEGVRHMPHHWMKADVAATIRTIHNNKKATIRQHYYPEGMNLDV
jgi:hypothetical protein